MAQESKMVEPDAGRPVITGLPVKLARGVRYVSRDPDFRGEVTIDSISGDRVYYSGDADGHATVEEFRMGYTLLLIEDMTIDQLHARLDLLSSEMDANEEESRAYQIEIKKICARIDAMKS
jgi:hypothetical protein